MVVSESHKKMCKSGGCEQSKVEVRAEKRPPTTVYASPAICKLPRYHLKG